MVSSFWMAIAVIATCAIITNGVIRIIKVSRFGGGKAGSQKLSEFEADLESLEADLDDARQRIEVLEKIVTDEKYDLGEKIDDLAN
ncbi:MAG: hypothetical protein IIA75_05755 [Proteobacteria bacterium]|nr:hypothetical protein [Pseudomonadota bacterium]